MVVSSSQDIAFEAIPPHIVAQLESKPWCSDLLEDPNLRPFNIKSRIPKNSTEDSIIAETLASHETVRIWQAFYKPSYSPTSAPGEFLFILSLGAGLNGHPNTLHGGAISLIFDETTSQVAYYHRSPDVRSYTATLTVDFKRPVPTPGLILCRAWLDSRSKGRKLWVQGTLEDGKGGVYALAQALFIEVPIRDQKL